jgi:hypothetical protein
MIVAVCVDPRGGMLFNGRRLSRDRAQQTDLLALCGGTKLWISPASAVLFAGREDAVVADADFLQRAGAGDICFVEAPPPFWDTERIEAVLIYRWNRSYPADRHFDLDLSLFQLTEQVDFPGTSHETITRERYERRIGAL